MKAIPVLFVADPSHKETFLKECSLLGIKLRPIYKGACTFVSSTSARHVRSLIFCRQALPLELERRFPSTDALARGLAAHIQRFPVDVTSTFPDGTVGASQLSRLIMKRLQQNPSTCALAPVGLPTQTLRPRHLALVTSQSHLYVARWTLEAHEQFFPHFSWWSAGETELVNAPQAPSRAYGKLREALYASHLPKLERQPQHLRAVELGASPGGWTEDLFPFFAHIDAVDRSPLAPTLMARSNIMFHEADAFRFEPEAPVDWMFSDVIAVPEKSIELLKRWIDQKWMKHFCVTLKFKGAPDVGQLHRWRQSLGNKTQGVVFKHHSQNKNEIMVTGSLIL